MIAVVKRERCLNRSDIRGEGDTCGVPPAAAREAKCTLAQARKVQLTAKRVLVLNAIKNSQAGGGGWSNDVAKCLG